MICPTCGQPLPLNRLSQHRIEKGFRTYRDLAKAASLSASAVWRFEVGEDAKVSSVEKIADVLSLSVSEALALRRLPAYPGPAPTTPPLELATIGLNS